MNIISMSASVSALVLALSILSFSTNATEGGNVFKDPLDAQTKKILGNLSLSKQPIVATEIIGKRIVSVGQRGLIIFSDDQGITWEQAEVPVQSDLTAIDFPTRDVGFVVGHDGVILASEDSGKTWKKKLDGNVSGPIFMKYYEDKMASGEDSLEGYFNQIEMNAEGGATLPYLSVYFENSESGYAVGAFGSIIRTEDGGDNWFPIMEKIDNPDFLHLNEIKKVGVDLYVVGERGTVWKWDRAESVFQKKIGGHGGSFFGITGNSQCKLVFGITGRVLRSDDSGDTWEVMETGTRSALVSGDTFQDGSSIVISEDGDIFRSNRSCGSLSMVTKVDNEMVSSVEFMREDSKSVVVTGYTGLDVVDFKW